MVWCVVWCGVVWCGVVCGVVSGGVWCGVVCDVVLSCTADCCDGSDEYATEAKCSDGCETLGRESAREARELIRRIEEVRIALLRPFRCLFSAHFSCRIALSVSVVPVLLCLRRGVVPLSPPLFAFPTRRAPRHAMPPSTRLVL